MSRHGPSGSSRGSRPAGRHPTKTLGARCANMSRVRGGFVRRSIIAIAICALWGSLQIGQPITTTVVHAQEGHPLTGTWAGDWGPTASERTHLTVVMNWNGKALAGLLNPGPDQAALSSITLDPATWMVHFEADAKNASGQP